MLLGMDGIGVDVPLEALAELIETASRKSVYSAGVCDHRRSAAAST
jgi:hypothetical protein